MTYGGSIADRLIRPVRAHPDGGRVVTSVVVRGDAVILSCAISAGIHAALVPAHFGEGTGAGVGFIAAAVVLGILAVVLTRTPSDLAFGVTATVLAGLIASYALATTAGFPLLHPEPEAVDGLALFTKAVETLGLVLAASLLRRSSLMPAVQRPKGPST